jgi:broad specificity phosphatase PhoE
MSAPLSPQREAEIRAFEEDEHRNVLTMGRDLDDLLAEIDRLRSETVGLRQGIERQEARTEYIAKQALRWKAEADGRKEYGEKLHAELDRLRAELAALPAPVVETAFRDALGNVWPVGHLPAETEARVLKSTPTIQRTVRISEWTEVTS